MKVRVRWARVLFLSALIATTIVFVPPAGNFPLNDDWMYGWMVRVLLDEHRFVQHVYNSPYAIVQTFWGAAFCAAFGYSYTVLRLSTVVFAVIAVWLTTKCARAMGTSRSVAAVCGAVVFANPIFLNLSYSFMTEIPYLALMLASGFFYLRSMRHGRTSDIFFGSAFAVMSFCNRQFGVLSTVAFLLALLLANRGALRHATMAKVAALAGPWLSLGMAYAYFGTGPASPFHMGGITGSVSAARQIGIVINVVFSLPLYIGIFLLPLACLSMFSARLRRWQWAILLVMGGGYTLLLLLGVAPLPRLPNLLRNLGVGPLTMYDTYFAHPGWSPVKAPAGVWLGVSIAAAFAAGALAARWVALLKSRGDHKSSKSAPRRAQYWFLFVWGAMLLVSPLNPGLNIYFDRYLLPGCFPLLVLTAAGLRMPERILSRAALFTPLVAMYFFSIVTLQDYLSWNRARWRAVALLQTKYGATQEQVDGGYEYNGTYTSEEFRTRHPHRPIDYSGERPWWVIDGLYAVSFLPREGYVRLDSVPYHSWLAGKDARLLILKRSP